MDTSLATGQLRSVLAAAVCLNVLVCRVHAKRASVVASALIIYA